MHEQWLKDMRNVVDFDSTVFNSLKDLNKWEAEQILKQKKILETAEIV